jgi:hypothetical protein
MNQVQPRDLQSGQPITCPRLTGGSRMQVNSAMPSAGNVTPTMGRESLGLQFAFSLVA